MQKWDWLDETYIEVFLNEFLESLLFRYQKRVYEANRRFSTFFQIDFEVIRTMRSKNFSFSFAENVGKFTIFRRDIGEIRSFCKFYRVSLNVRRMKIEFKIVRAWKFWCAQEYYSTNNSDIRLLGVRRSQIQVWKLQSPMIVEGCPKRMEIPMVCWLQHKKERDFPTKMNRSLLTHLPSQSVDCARQASYIQGPKSRKNQAEWHRSPDLYNHQ